MEPSLIEVLDTAVKIGLGAVISGVVSYVIITTKNKHEMQTYKKDKTISFLVELKNVIEATRFKLDEAAHPLWKGNAIKDTAEMQTSKTSIDLYLDAIKLVGESRALASMLSLNCIVGNLNDIEEFIYFAYQKASEQSLVKEAEEFNKRVKKSQQQFCAILKQIAICYEKS